MKERVLNEITTFCNECSSKECCPESECILHRIEQVILNKVYQAEVKEELSRVVEVEAVSVEEAISIVEDKYLSEEIVLDYHDNKEYSVGIYRSDVSEE